MAQTHLKTRFCPSPTGLLHLGNIRTALFNALLACGKKGIFLLRIEDTDKVRSDARYAKLIQQDLRWLSMQWQEGPGCDSDDGPYWQSQRQGIYDEYYHRLEQEGHAYPCFCSEQQLALSRKVQLASGRPPRYAGTCRSLSQDEIAEKIADGIKPTLRFRVPQNLDIVFHDMVRGEQSMNTHEIGDFIIRRTDGTSPFMFCNAIDDALMGVTHVLRGEDHLTNTPRQILILQTLELPIPTYGHIALVVGNDGAPLSKRHGSRTVQELKQQGFLPSALINYLARVGHHYQDENTLMSFARLAEYFNIKALGKAPARFDPNQLLYWQREAIAHADQEKIWRWMGNEVQQLVPKAAMAVFVDTVKHNISFPEDAIRWAKVIYGDINFGAEQQMVLVQTGHDYFNIALKTLNKHGADIKNIINTIKEQLGIKGKALYHPLRIALTNETEGPELVKIFSLLGPDRVRQRLEQAHQLIAEKERT